MILEGVELRDPDGGIVASVSGLEVRVRLAALVQRRIDVTLVRLDGPELHLRLDESGSNLQRAIARAEPTPKPEKESQKSSLGFVLESLEIAHGVIDVVQRSADASRHIHLDDLETQGSAKLVGDALEAELEIAANVAAPFEGPFQLSLHGTGAGERKTRAARARARDREARGHGARGEREHRGRPDRVARGPPEIVKAFSSSYPLRAVASLSAEASRKGDELSLRLDAKAASATARVDGTFDLSTKPVIRPR